MAFYNSGDKLDINCDLDSHPSCTAVILKYVMTGETGQHTLRKVVQEKVMCFKALLVSV